MKSRIALVGLYFLILQVYAQHDAVFRPHRILLTWSNHPSISATVTWRSASTLPGLAELARTSSDPTFDRKKTTVEAKHEIVIHENDTISYFTVEFNNLEPSSGYAYRVGNGTTWSEWLQFKTAPVTFQPFSFIYLGDAQNKIFSHWSRVIRAAYADSPQAAFIVHAGDLINHADDDGQWGEWFSAGAFIHSTIPAVATVGNHEYIKNDAGVKVSLSKFWRPQFNYPLNGPEGLEDQTYYVDYPGMRIISLNSNKELEVQALWLEKVLRENQQRWTMITFHHPIYSAAEGRENEGIVKHWKPIFDRYRVDLVLQGHDHTYARGTANSKPSVTKDETGTVYVVSVAGTKMYELSKNSMWMKQATENKQLYQLLTVTFDKIRFVSKGVDGEVIDAFEIHKQKKGNNKVVEILSTIMKK